MHNIKTRLLNLTSSELSDALDSLGIEGALREIKPIVKGSVCVGRAFTVKYEPYEEKPSEFQNAGNYIDYVPDGSVIVIDNQGREDCTVWGNILTQYALRKQIAGTIVNGAVRDISYILSSQYPLFSKSVFMRSGKNRVKKVEHQTKITISGISIHPDDIIFGDSNGVLVIPKECVENVIGRAENIVKTEDKIIASIASGDSLENARCKFSYHKPWEDLDVEQTKFP